MIFADGSRPSDGEFHGAFGARSDGQIGSVIADLQLTVQPQFDAQMQAAHPRLDLILLDLITLRGEGKGEIVGDRPVLDVRQDRGQILGGGQRAMVIGEILDGPRELLIRLRPILLLQKRVGPRQRVDPGESQLLHQAILCRVKTAFHAAFGLRREGQNRADAQLAQAAPNLRHPVGGGLLLAGTRRRGKH